MRRANAAAACVTCVNPSLSFLFELFMVRVSSAGAACFPFEGVPHAARLLKVQSLQQFEELVWRFRGVTRRSQNANPVAQCVPALLILPILEEF